MQGRWNDSELAKEQMIDYSNSRMKEVIEEYVHSERDRGILKRRYIDGICFESLAEEYNLSVRQAKNIVYKYEAVLFKHLEGDKTK